MLRLLPFALLAAASPAVRTLYHRADTTATTTTSLPTEAWVTVDKNGIPSTVTPTLTTVDGEDEDGEPTSLASVIDGLPTTKPKIYDETTTAFTAQPSALKKSGQGAFAACHNLDGVVAPFCAPTNGSLLKPGSTYYITWDPAFFADNTSLVVRGRLYDDDGSLSDRTAFRSDDPKNKYKADLYALRSYYAWTVDKKLLTEKSHREGIYVYTEMILANGTILQGPLVNVADPPLSDRPRKSATGPGVYIGIPVSLGFVVLMLCGTCCYLAHKRRIGLGSVTSHRRFGDLSSDRYGRRRRNRNKNVAVDNADGSMHLRGIDRKDEYHDDPATHGGIELSLDMPRTRAANDDDLGSLAGTPTEERFGGASGPSPYENNDHSEGNVFRDELRRQKQQRAD